jgi:hypothetical protein
MNQTTYTSKFYLVKPLSDNQDNKVDFTPNSYHTWSNQRGYGNIVVATNDSSNAIRGSINPWNRLPPMEKTFDTFVRIESAWATNPMNCNSKN